MEKVLVTGGAGFIGSHLVEGLVKSGRKVRVLDNFSTGRKENLAGLYSKIDLVRGDVRKPNDLKKSMRGVSKVFHMAAIASVPLSVDDPITTFDVNIKGTWNVLEAAREGGVKRVVFISSASVYGSDSPVPFKESMPLQGSSPYASSKLVGEQLCTLYWSLYGLETAALRLFSVYGPRQNPRSQYANVIPAFSTRVLCGKQATIYGDGKQTRDFIFVKDVVRALMIAGRKRTAVGQIVNFGSGKRTSVNQLLKNIQKVLGTNIPADYQPAKPGDDPHTGAHTAKYKKVLGIKNVTSLQDGLRITCEWFRDSYKG